MYFNDDICWCGNSENCTHTECFRHLENKPDEERIFTMSYLKWTEYCPVYNEKEGESNEF